MPELVGKQVGDVGFGLMGASSSFRDTGQLLNAYFEKYPEDAEKVVLSIKGGLLPGQMRPDGSQKNVQRSIDECLKWLDGKKSLDLFECMSGKSIA